MRANLVPTFILENHARQISGGEFEAVALFADISGFSAVTNALVQHGSEAAEHMADIMLRVFDPLVDAVYAQGGFITTFAGDAFTAIFPCEPPETLENQTQRALAAAVTMQKHFVGHHVQETPYGKFSFAVKLGLASGNVEWGILSPKQATVPSAYYFRGTAVDATSIAEHHANPGNIILSNSVAEALGKLVKTLVIQEDKSYRRLLKVEGTLPPAQVLPEAEIAPNQELFIMPEILTKHMHGEFRDALSVFINLQGIQSGRDLANFMEGVFNLLAIYGGNLTRVDFGDKGSNLLIFWGMPTSTENDVERALKFILDLSIHSSNTYRAGINYDLMYAGLAGSARRAEYTAYGNGINYAARLMMKAPWGSIWLGEKVIHRAGKQFEFEKVGEFEFKGFTEPQPVYALLGQREVDAYELFQGTMVGRKAELTRLHEFIQPILHSDEQEQRFGGILSIEGEAGLGKSRLVAEFMNQTTSETGNNGNPPQWFLCQTNQTVHTPLNPFCYWLRNYFNQSSTQSEILNKHAFNRKLDGLIATLPNNDLQEILERGRSFLGFLVDLHWENSPYTQLNPEGRQEWTVKTLKALILAESLRQPVILNIEDAHWLDTTSVAFIERLVRQIEHYPIAILATSRPTIGDKPLLGTLKYDHINLNIMANAELHSLAQELLGAPIAKDVANLLNDRAEGNPFFAEQILLFLREAKQIQLVEGKWQGVGGLADTPLPDDVRAIFTARLDQLTMEVKLVVQTAAILGREFEVQVLSQILRNDPSLPDKLRVAEAETIWSALTQVQYLFRHALLRDAAYQMQLRARRRELHQLAAEALETLNKDDATLIPFDQIAYHYEAAYQQGHTPAQTPAIMYLQKAGEEAAANYENSIAIDYFSRALEITLPDDHARRYELLLGRENVYQRIGNRVAQTQDLDALKVLADTWQQPSEQAEVALRIARQAEEISEYEKAIQAVQNALSHAQIAGDVGREADAQLLWGAVLWRQGKHVQSQEHLNQASALAQAEERSDIEVNVLRVLGSIAGEGGDYAEAQRYYEQSLALAYAIKDRPGEATALHHLGILAESQANFASAWEYYGHSFILAREIGSRQREATALNSLGVLAEKQGDFAGAWEFYQQGLVLRREIGNRRGEGTALNNLGGIANKQGDYALARKYFQQSLALTREIGNRRGETLALFNLASIAEGQKNFHEARDIYEQGLQICREAGFHELMGYLLTGLGYTLTELEYWMDAQTALDEAWTIRAGMGNQVLLMETQVLQAYLQFAQGVIEQAYALLEDVLAFLDSTGNKFDGGEYPLRNLYMCFQLLQANSDPRADEILHTAYTWLQTQATNINNENTRQTFLHNIPWHENILLAHRGKTQLFTLDGEEEMEAPATPIDAREKPKSAKKLVKEAKKAAQEAKKAAKRADKKSKKKDKKHKEDDGKDKKSKKKKKD